MELLPFLRPRPHYTREIWKRSIISKVKPTVHTNSSRKRSFYFRKRSSKNAAFAVYCGRKTLWKRGFRKRWRVDNHVLNPSPQWCTQTFLPLVIVACNQILRRSTVIWASELQFRASNYSNPCKSKSCLRQLVKKLSCMQMYMISIQGRTPLYGLYGYVRPQRVWFFSRFGHK